MKKGKLTQAQRLYHLEKALYKLHLSLLTLQQKLNRLEAHTGIVEVKSNDEEE